MMDNTLGNLFRITTFGESHGKSIGVVIDGLPAGTNISLEKIQAWLDRRKPGQSELTTSRQEKDHVECVSGLEKNVSLGSPLCFLVWNHDVKKKDYQEIKKVFRPSHADFTYEMKYGIRSQSGGGRASARETIGRVIAASVAEQFLQMRWPNFSTVGFVSTVKDITFAYDENILLAREEVDKNFIRCPDKKSARQMEKIILAAKNKGDTVGGIVSCFIYGLPVGLGSPVFDKFDADLAKAMMSLPASKGFDIGMGFDAIKLYGSQHNDPFKKEDGQIIPGSNRSGGVQGGITNGAAVYFRVAFKPVSTVFVKQATVDKKGHKINWKPTSGRHDPCVLPRAVPMVEAMAILVTMDHFLRAAVYKI